MRRWRRAWVQAALRSFSMSSRELSFVQLVFYKRRLAFSYVGTWRGARCADQLRVLPLWTRPLLAGRSFFDFGIAGRFGLRVSAPWIGRARSRPSAGNLASLVLTIAPSPRCSHARHVVARAGIFIAKAFERRAESAHPLLFCMPARLTLFGVAAGRYAARRQKFSFGRTNPFPDSPPLLHRGTALVTRSGDRRCYT